MSASTARVPLIAGNWKMHKTGAEARAYLQELRRLLGHAGGDDPDGAERAAGGPDGAPEVGVCVPFTALAPAMESVAGSPLRVYAQNMHQEEHGAFTGEVSAAMLTELGVHGTVLGHSERRALFGETDRALALKLPAALRAGLLPILCVGETEEQRNAGATERTLRHQVTEDLAAVADAELGGIVIAYEPIWAIGTGKVATTEQAQEASAFIRALLAARDAAQAQRTRIIYGGSVKPENAAELLSQADVDGALVGGASLDPASFAAIAGAAAG